MVLPDNKKYICILCGELGALVKGRQDHLFKQNKAYLDTIQHVSGKSHGTHMTASSFVFLAQ